MDILIPSHYTARMEKILISACLLGEKVRYDGKDSKQQSDLLAQWRQEGRLVSICPEMAGGLPTPRPPARIVGIGGGAAVLNFQAKVMTDINQDVTDAYKKGAEAALALIKKHNIKIAILKARSPSCGNLMIYDGSLNDKKLVPGQGVTATLLSQHGVTVFNEEQLDKAQEFLSVLDSK